MANLIRHGGLFEDLFKEGKTYHARVAVPGIDPNQVQVNLQGNILSIHVEQKESAGKKGVDDLRREFRYFLDRILILPEGTDTEKVTAEFNNGVLEITAPMAATAMPRRIEIKGVAKPKIASVA